MILRRLWSFLRTWCFLTLILLLFVSIPSLTLADDTGPLSEQYQQARQLRAENQHQQSYDTLRSVLEREPDTSLRRRVHYLMGVNLRELDKHPVKALKHFHHVYGNPPHDNLTDDALYFTAEILREPLDQPEKATSYLNTLREHFAEGDYAPDARSLLEEIDVDTDPEPKLHDPEDIPPPTIQLNFRETDLRDFINTYSRLTGKNFLLSGDIRGTVTLIGRNGIPLNDLFRVFNEVLESRGYTAIRSGRVYEIQQIQQALQSGIGTDTRKSGLRSEFFNLRNLPWNDVISALNTLLPQEKNLVRLREFDRVLVTARPEKLDQVREAIGTFRVMQSLEQKTVTLHYTPDYTSPGELSSQLNSLLSNYVREENFSILTDETSGKITVVLPSSRREKARQLIDQIDRDIDQKLVKNLKIKVFRLEHAEVDTIKQKVTDLLEVTPGNFASENVKIVADNRQKALIVSSTSPNTLELIGNTIEELDRPRESVPENIRVYRLEHADENEISETLREIKNLLPGEYPGGEVKFIPHERRRAIIVAAESAKVFSIVEDVINQIDKEDVQQPMTHHVYQVQNSDAGPLAEKLSSLFESRQGESDGRQLRVSADEQSNSLVVSASPQQWDTVKRMLKDLDRKKAQILVDVYIAEASKDLTDELGVEWTADGSISIDNTSRNIEVGPDFGLRDQRSSSGQNLFGFNASLFQPGGGSLQAIVHALDEDDDFNLLSSSHLVASDNEEANLSVGEIVPLKTQESTSSEGTLTQESFEFEDVGIELAITPTLGSDSTVSLDVEQQIEEVIGSEGQGLPTRRTRDVNTKVAVPNQETLVLGGVIQSQQNDVRSTVPYLGQVPGLRWLFTNETDETQQRNLLLFLKPRIMDTTEKMRDATESLNEQRKQETSLEERIDQLEEMISNTSNNAGLPND